MHVLSRGGADSTAEVDPEFERELGELMREHQGGGAGGAAAAAPPASPQVRRSSPLVSPCRLRSCKRALLGLGVWGASRLPRQPPPWPTSVSFC